MSFDQPPEPKVGDAPPPPMAFGEKQASKKKRPQSTMQTFLGADTQAMATQLGGKTLLGQ